MAHTTEIIGVQHVSDGQVAVKLRCCGDESTDSVHSVEVSNSTEADLKEWLNGRHAHVQGLHDEREAAKRFFESLKTKSDPKSEQSCDRSPKQI